HAVRVVNYSGCAVCLTPDTPGIVYRDRPLEHFEAIVPRIGPAGTFYGTTVVRQFETLGSFVVNSAEAIARSRDKFCCLQLLARAGIAVPRTSLALSPDDLDALVASVSHGPLIIKLLQSSKGNGVIRAETTQAAKSIIVTLQSLGIDVLVQEFIQEANGTDLRCFVVGDRVVAAMQRRGKPGEFRANLHQGGSAEPIELTPEERSIAVRSAKTMGLQVAGVDLLRSQRGPLVLEVNSSPGLGGIERCTGVDVAGTIVSFLEAHVLPG
ncbi:MAG: 30S ribosomal protein S6--L-glutamate ligase, partial [Cyanobacteria bacterium J06641_5]